MTMFDSRLFLVLLVVLVPSLGSAPGSDELHDKLEELLGRLVDVKADFPGVFDIIDKECPCLTPWDPDCFETPVLDINSTLCDLISNLTELIDVQPDDCPPLEGCAVLVGGYSSTGMHVVDPVGQILPEIETTDIVDALTVKGSDDSDYTILYTASFPLKLVKLHLPAGTEQFYVNPFDGIPTGIALCEHRIFMAINDTDGNHVIYHFAGEIIVNISCAGRVRAYNGLVYFSDCNEIQCVNKTGGDLVTKMKFSVKIVSFDVIDNDTIVFCDNAGGLWIYNIGTGCFKLLDCNLPCGDVKVSPCSRLIYVAYPNDPVLDIFNHTTCEKEGTLTYATTLLKSRPLLEFKPPRALEGDL